MAISLPLALALAEFGALPRILIASDFDGVLAPFELDPMAVRPVPGVIATLQRLGRAEATSVAVVSGRPLWALHQLSGLGAGGPIVLVGSHGAEATHPDALAAPPLTSSQLMTLVELENGLVAIRSRFPGSRVERKSAGCTLHTRGLPHHIAEPALAAAREFGEARPSVRVIDGKSVVELAVSHADKGSSLLRFQAATRSDAVLYLGDDLTDEDAFAALAVAPRNVTVKVGAGASQAGYRVDTPAEVAELLGGLVERRS